MFIKKKIFPSDLYENTISGSLLLGYSKYNLLIEYIKTNAHFGYRILLLLLNLFCMLSVADMQQMMKHATNSTRMYIPARKMRIINHIDGNNCVYQTLMTSSIFLLGLTNAIIL